MRSRRSLLSVGTVIVALAAALTQAPAASAASFTGVSAGLYHSCAVVSGGVRCWGRNDHGQLGDGTTIDSDGPLSVKGLTTGVAAVVSGMNQSCALTVAGAVKCWGDNSAGQLGNGTQTDSPVPVTVKGMASGVTDLSTGGLHTCAIKAGAVKCWGYNGIGALGNGTFTDSATPVAVKGLGGGVSAVSAGAYHTCALKAGAMWCWGANDYGELGDGTILDRKKPVAVSGLTSGVTAISAGWIHTCAIVSDAAECWGRDFFGQLGDGSNTDSLVPVPVSGLGSGSGVSVISAGEFHSCAVVSGAAQCWGYNGYGQLGDGSHADSNVPVAATGLGGSPTVFAEGQTHTCAVVVSGAAQCWGFNGFGELGDGSLTDRDAPTDIAAQTALKLSMASSVVQDGLLTLKVTVTSGAGVPTGTVDLFIDGTLVGSGTLSGAGKLTTVISVTQSVGPHQVWAVYEGATPQGGSHNLPKTLTVTP